MPSLSQRKIGAIVTEGVALMAQLETLGVSTYVDATPLDGGRQPERYKEITAQSGMNIVCSAGYYRL